MAENDRPIANPSVVLREESDEWAILFDPDTGKSFGLNPISVFAWKRLDGRHTIRDIVVDLCHDYENVPEEAEAHIQEFVQCLVERGLARHEAQEPEHDHADNEDP